MQGPDLISIVITTYNRSDALLAVLSALTRQSDRHFEVIVADDGSRDEHRQRILQSEAAQALKLFHVWHPDVGFTASKVRNRGVAAALGNYIVFLDGDCVPENDFVARHRALAAPGCFVNGSRVLLSPGLTQRVLAGQAIVDGRGAGFWLLKRLKGEASKLTALVRLPDGAFRVRQQFSWKGIRSCNLAVWKRDFERVDGFDESFIGWGHEDADFVLRLHNLGIARKNGFCATEVFHLWHKEASRSQESENASTVARRAATKIVQPTLGYARLRENDDLVLTRTG
jgi:glycosyltransferase involved in cell wall biosynthesis